MSDVGLDGSNPSTVLLSGASGMLGSAIGKALRQRGNGVLRLVRREARGADELSWNPAPQQASQSGTHGEAFGIGEVERLEGIGAAVHLSGANVAARRWTAAYKKEMMASRVTTTRVLAERLAGLRRRPAVLVTASAVGFYGDRGEMAVDEDSAAGQGYLAELCAAWEAAARPATEAGIRVVHLRFGMVIGREGGALARLAPLFRLGLGGRLGDGRQWMSWVSEADAVGAVLFALDGAGSAAGSALAGAQDGPLNGPLNVVAPEPVTNAGFTRRLAHAVHRPAVMNAPAWALRLVFGEMADEALLASTRVVPKRLLEAGYVFRYPTLAEAFAVALGSAR